MRPTGIGSSRAPLIACRRSALVSLALVIILVVSDTSLVLQAYERSASSTSLAVVLAVAVALGTVLAVIWYRRRVGRLGDTKRRVLGWAGIVWAGLFVVGFVLTHPRHRDDAFATTLEVAVTSYCLFIVVMAVCFAPIAVLRLARPPSHDPQDQIRVWEVRDEEKSFFVAYCNCGWVGTAYDATDPHARDKAFHDARKHGTNVAAESSTRSASPHSVTCRPQNLASPAKVLARTVNPSGRGATYELTEMGVALRTVMDAMGQWGAHWLKIELRHGTPRALGNAATHRH